MNYNKNFSVPPTARVGVERIHAKVGLFGNLLNINYATRSENQRFRPSQLTLSVFLICTLLSCATPSHTAKSINTDEQIMIIGKDGNESYYEVFTYEGHQYLISFYSDRTIIHLASCNGKH